MKKRFFLPASAALIFWSGCGMLDIQPVNRVIPETVQDFESVLVAGYPSTDIFIPLAFLTDDVYLNEQTEQASIPADYQPFFVWAGTHQPGGQENDPLWGQFYKSIFYANTIIENLPDLKPSLAEQELYETILGEAYALRAYSLFYLVNLYADVYAPENLDKPGVPLALAADDVNNYLGNNDRQTVGIVWDQLVRDLETAADYLRAKPSKGVYRFDYYSLHALKARAYLFMGEYEKTIQAATEVIDAKTLFNMNIFQSRIDAEEKGNQYVFGDYYGFISSDYRKEVLLFTGNQASNNAFYYWKGQHKPDYSIYDLCMRYQGPFDDRTDIESMPVADYRAYAYCYFMPSDADDYPLVGRTCYKMYTYSGDPTYHIAFKLSEMYVTRAEALMRSSAPNKARAVADLNALLKNRIRESVFEELTAEQFATNEAVINRILEERRLETVLEAGLRWFDLRRLGKPELRHSYRNNLYTLYENDPRYLLQIPLSEQIASPDMPLNPR
ncbi:MAG: RagB/SusD family nutrient uptake outer membrane protein [Rikenellaceae bacterium]|nr:RagB/SusD family nutrient uptake outer membrane protein [Rikenellaceae bacterium]